MRTNLLTQLSMMEQSLSELPMPITFLRPARYMENCAWDVAPARDTWESLFKSQGMNYPDPRIQMLDGFNQGWIQFEQDPTRRRKGRVGLKEVLAGLAGISAGAD